MGLVPDKCHAGAGHGVPSDRGPWGWLCDSCWERMRVVMAARGIHLAGPEICNDCEAEIVGHHGDCSGTPGGFGEES